MRRKETKRTEDSDAFSKQEHKHNNLVASLDYLHVHKSIIYVAKQLANGTKELG